MAGGDGDGLDLLVGVQPGLAGLQLDEVEHLGLAARAPGRGSGAGRRRAAVPGSAAQARLGGAGPLEGLRDVLGGGLGQVGQLLPGERGVVGGAAGADHARVSWATSSGVTTSAAVRHPGGWSGATGLPPVGRVVPASPSYRRGYG